MSQVLVDISWLPDRFSLANRYKSRQIFVDLPDGGRRPFCDPADVAYMMSTSPALALCLLILGNGFW